MDPIKNPFSPGAGSPPPELVGRDPILEEARILLGRTKAGKPEKSMLLTGLRGVGKTVLLNEIERMGRNLSFHTITIEAQENAAMGPLLAPHLRNLLFELDRVSGAGEKVRRGLRVLRSFISSLSVSYDDLKFSLDIEPEKGAADSGHLGLDLSNLFLAVGDAAQDKNSAIVLLIDEIQYFSSEEFGALIVAMHKAQQRQIPFALIGAGLPFLPRLAGEAKSYAERLFSFSDVGALSEEESAKALREPALAAGVEFEATALQEVFQFTKGYPYFLQEWGYQSWNLAESSPITLALVQKASAAVISRLDRNFFRVRFDRLTPNEKNFLRGMAELGPGNHRTADIAARLGVNLNRIGPVRDRLIKKGMVYSPAHGEMAFTVPLFDEFMVRAIPKFAG